MRLPNHNFAGLHPAGFFLSGSITRVIKFEDGTNEVEKSSPSVWPFFEVDNKIEVVSFSTTLDSQSPLSHPSPDLKIPVLYSLQELS